jgi:hypothetical protein
MTTHVTTYEQLLDRLIADGIAEVQEAYADPKEHHKRDGAIEGFDSCRGKDPVQLVDLWKAAEQEAARIRIECHENNRSSEDYWRARYKALQIEFVCNVVSVGLTASGSPPLLAHLPTSRGALKYAQIVGVAPEGLS